MEKSKNKDSEPAKLTSLSSEQSCYSFTSNVNTDHTVYNVTVSAILTGLGAEKYMEMFKQRNIEEYTLMELTDDDLEKIGVDDPDIRAGIISEVQNLPIYEKVMKKKKLHFNLDLVEITEILENTNQQLYRMFLSMLANNITLKKQKDVRDVLVVPDKYASNVTIDTIQEISSVLNKMDAVLHTYVKNITYERNKKKVIVGTVGTVVITILTVLFVQSLKPFR